MVVQFLAMLEILVEGNNPIEEAQRKLDAFREATNPSDNYGIWLYRLDEKDLDAMSASYVCQLADGVVEES